MIGWHGRGDGERTEARSAIGCSGGSGATGASARSAQLARRLLTCPGNACRHSLVPKGTVKTTRRRLSFPYSMLHLRPDQGQSPVQTRDESDADAARDFEARSLGVIADRGERPKMRACSWRVRYVPHGLFGPFRSHSEEGRRTSSLVCRIRLRCAWLGYLRRGLPLRNIRSAGARPLIASSATSAEHGLGSTLLGCTATQGCSESGAYDKRVASVGGMQAAHGRSHARNAGSQPALAPPVGALFLHNHNTNASRG